MKNTYAARSFVNDDLLFAFANSAAAFLVIHSDSKVINPTLLIWDAIAMREQVARG